MALRPADFDLVCGMLHAHTGIRLPAEKSYFVESRLATFAAYDGDASVDALLARVRDRSATDLHARLVEAMLVGETSFFRDPSVFEALRKTILPALAALPSAHIWCAASSTGQEPYSVAMLLAQHHPASRVVVVASDVSESNLERARAGAYSTIEVNRGLPATSLVRWFEQKGPEFRVRDSVRRFVDFHRINLHASTLPAVVANADVVLLRNVLIYFDPVGKRAVLERVRRTMSPRGYLFLGSAETTLGLDDGFVTTTIDGATCFRPRRG